MDAKAQASFDALDETLLRTREQREAAYAKIGALKDVIAQLVNDKAQVVHLQPDDVLLIGNVGGDSIGHLAEALEQAMPNTKKFLFAEAIDVDLLRDLSPCPYCSNPEGWDACPVHRDGEAQR